MFHPRHAELCYHMKNKKLWSKFFIDPKSKCTSNFQSSASESIHLFKDLRNNTYKLIELGFSESLIIQNVKIYHILCLNIILYFIGAWTNPPFLVSGIGSDWPLTISYFWTKAVKNLYNDILAKTSPRHLLFPTPNGITRSCGWNSTSPEPFFWLRYLKNR